MTYLSTEASQYDNVPVEIYKFEGTFNNYFYTSAELDILFGVDTYTAIPISRSAVRTTTQEDDNTDLQLELPYDIPLVVAYGYTKAPPNLILEVRRWSEGNDPATENAIIWKGPVSSFSISGRKAKIRVPSIFGAALRAEVPNRYYHSPCNHILYDSRCAVLRTSFDQVTTVTNINTVTGELTVASDGFGDSFLKGGEIVNNRTTERRLVIDNLSDVLTINFAFSDIILGDSVTLYAGCDHSFSTCGTKFSNKARFGGDPYIPSENPFEGEL